MWQVWIRSWTLLNSSFDSVLACKPDRVALKNVPQPNTTWIKQDEITFSDNSRFSLFVFTHSSGSDQSQREEDFYYTKISCETVDTAQLPSQQVPCQTASSHLSWASYVSAPASGLQIPPTHRPRSNSSSGPRPSRPSPLSQSAPSSFWQIHSEHLYQVGPAAPLSSPEEVLTLWLGRAISKYCFIQVLTFKRNSFMLHVLFWSLIVLVPYYVFNG